MSVGPRWQKWYAKVSWGRVNRRKLGSASLGRPRIRSLPYHSPHALQPSLFSIHVVRRRIARPACPRAPWAHSTGRRWHLFSRRHREGEFDRRSLVFRICWSFSPTLLLAGSEYSLNSCLSMLLWRWNVQSLEIKRTRPRPPAPNSVILGTITRMSPLQATLSITVVDGVPLPAGEEFTGVVRVQDVRATEKDRVKIADCFRGGDVVRGLVVSVETFEYDEPPQTLPPSCLWAMQGVTM